MKRAHDSGKATGTRPGRRSIPVTTVTAAVALMERDGSDRPQPVTTLMGVVRLMAPIILAHRNSGWSDPQIAALLRERGFEIGVGTLTVYRHRLIEEFGGVGAHTRPFDADAPPAATRLAQASQADSAALTQPARLSVSTAPQAPARPGSGTSNGAPEPPRFNPNIDHDDIV